jgi:hypothetical protein
MGKLTKKAEALNQNPSISRIIGLVEEMAVAIDSLLPNDKCEEIVKETDNDLINLVEAKPKRKKKNV